MSEGLEYGYEQIRAHVGARARTMLDASERPGASAAGSTAREEACSLGHSSSSIATLQDHRPAVRPFSLHPDMKQMFPPIDPS